MLKRMRERRRVMRVMRSIASGQWHALLKDLTKHRFPMVRDNQGRAAELCVKLNHVRLAMRKHAQILCGKPPIVTAPEGNDTQQAALNETIRRGQFGLLIQKAAVLVNVEGAAYLSAVVASTAGGRGPVVRLEKNEQCFPMGRAGPDGQPTAYERRWVIERPDPRRPRKVVRFLRVESHWLPDDGGGGAELAAVAQRAYRVESDDVLAVSVADTKNAVPVALSEVGPEAAALPELTMLPGPELAVCELVIGHRVDGATGGDDAEPSPRLDLNDIDLIAALTMGLTRYVRSMEVHGTPKMRVPEAAFDKKTNTVDLEVDAFVDDEKVLEYITSNHNFADMLTMVEKIADWLMAGVEMTQALLGISAKDTQVHRTFGELELNATNPLAAAQSAAAYFTPPIERVFTVCSRLASALPGGMFDVAPVNVRFLPGLPKTFSDRVSEQDRALAAGLTSRRRALAAVHEGENPDDVLAEIEADEEARVGRAQRSLMLEMQGQSGVGSGQSGEGGEA
ncbi:MAG: hypothetical protein ACKVZJ_10335 [Phycisphaerales bacterium]